MCPSGPVSTTEVAVGEILDTIGVSEAMAVIEVALRYSAYPARLLVPLIGGVQLAWTPCPTTCSERADGASGGTRMEVAVATLLQAPLEFWPLSERVLAMR